MLITIHHAGGRREQEKAETIAREITDYLRKLGLEVSAEASVLSSRYPLADLRSENVSVGVMVKLTDLLSSETDG